MRYRTSGRLHPGGVAAGTLLFCLFLIPFPVVAQVDGATTGAPRQDSLALLFADPDTVDVRGDSLPDHMPLVTRALWGRSGLLRKAGLAPEYRRHELLARRSMLTWHQRLGLVTLGAMTTQVITGVLIDRDPARYHERYQPVHRALGYTTFGLYTVTAGFSLAAPPARRYHSGLSSIKIHRYLAVVHFTGMMLQPWLGRALARETDPDARERLQRIHRINGWVTYGAFTGAVASIILPLP